MKKSAATALLGWMAVFSGALLLQATDMLACTSFSAQQGEIRVFGRSYDWYMGEVMAFIGPRHRTRIADPPPDVNSPDAQNPAIWTSKYGNISFGMSPVNVTIGMNEAGLIVSSNSLEVTEYERPDSRPSVNSAQWIAYLLDNFSSVDEVIASTAKVRIRQYSKSVSHYNGSIYLVADKSGNTAVIEFRNAHMQCYKNARLITNSIYSVANAYAGSLGNSFDSLERFFRVKTYLADFKPNS